MATFSTRRIAHIAVALVLTSTQLADAQGPAAHQQPSIGKATFIGITLGGVVGFLVGTSPRINDPYKAATVGAVIGGVIGLIIDARRSEAGHISFGDKSCIGTSRDDRSITPSANEPVALRRIPCARDDRVPFLVGNDGMRNVRITVVPQ